MELGNRVETENTRTTSPANLVCGREEKILARVGILGRSDVESKAVKEESDHGPNEATSESAEVVLGGLSLVYARRDNHKFVWRTERREQSVKYVEAELELRHTKRSFQRWFS